MAIIPTVSRLAEGMSAQTKSTPASLRPKRKWALREAVELGDHQFRAAEPAGLDGVGQDRSLLVRLLAGFDLDELASELPAAAVEEIFDGLPLRLQAEAGAALAVGADPQVRDPPAFGHLVCSLTIVNTEVISHVTFDPGLCKGKMTPAGRYCYGVGVSRRGNSEARQRPPEGHWRVLCRGG